MKILFLGDLELDGQISAPSKVGYEVFGNALVKYSDVIFLIYFQDGTKYSRYQKLFGKQEEERGIIRVGVFPFLFYIIKYKPKIVHITSISVYYLIAFPLLKLIRAKIFYNVHNVNKYTLQKYTHVKKNIKRRILLCERLSVYNSTKICLLSEYEKSYLTKNYNVPQKKIEIVDNGVNDIKMKKNYLLSGQNDIFRIVTVGSFDRQEKGLEQLIEFLGTLEKTFDLTICYYKKHQKKNNINKSNVSIQFLDLSTEVELRAEFIKNDIFVSLAEYEPFGMALLEAMNSGLLFIASERIGLTERFNPRLKEYVVPIDDHKLIGDKMTNLLTMNDALKQNLSEDIIAFSMQFSWEKVARKYFSLYEN